MEERALTNADLGSGGTISAQQRPDLGPGACPRRSGTGTTQPLGATRGRLAWAGAALAPPTRSRSDGRGPGVPSPSRALGQPGSDGSLRTGLGPPSASPPRAVGGCRAGVAKAQSPGWVALAGKGFGVGRRDPGAGSGRGLGAWRAGGRSGGRGEGGAADGGGSVRSRAQGQPWPPRSKAAWRERPGAEGLTGRRGRAEQVQIFPGTPGPGRPLSPVPLDPPPCAHAPSLFPAPRGRAPATTPAPALIASEVPGVEFLGRGF